MDTLIERLVDEYAQALAGGSGEQIASFYDSSVLFVSDESSVATENDDEFAAWFGSTAETYRARGFGVPIGRVTRTEVLTGLLILAYVTWDYRGVSGDPMFEADYVYGLRSDGQRLAICTVWSLNEAGRAAEYLQHSE